MPSGQDDDESQADEDEPSSPPVSGEEGAFWAVLGGLGSFVIVVFVGILVLAAGFGGDDLGDTTADDAGGTAAAPAGDADAGAEIYAARCASCHGAAGEGGVGPSFDGVAERFPDIADQIAVVVDGQNNMPAFGGQLDDAEIEAVVAYERLVLDGS